MRATNVPRALAVGLLSLAAGCAAPGVKGPSPFDGSPRQAIQGIPELSIDVDNDHWMPVRVWLERPDGRFFVGDIEPGRTGTFRVPGYLVKDLETLRLFAEAAGSVDHVLSDPLDLRRGRHVEFRLRRVLASSRARVM